MVITKNAGKHNVWVENKNYLFTGYAIGCNINPCSFDFFGIFFIDQCVALKKVEG